MRFLAAVAAVLLLSGCASTAPDERLSEQAPTQQDQVTQGETQSAKPTAEDTVAERQESVESTTELQPTAEPEPAEPIETEASDPEPTETQTETPEAEPSPEPVPEPTIVGYTLQEVSERNSQSDCWVAIDGGVYDLTMWIRSHPGGSAAILQLCGTDGTQMFLGQHGGQARPASALDGYYIGPLR